MEMFMRMYLEGNAPRSFQNKMVHNSTPQQKIFFSKKCQYVSNLFFSFCNIAYLMEK